MIVLTRLNGTRFALNSDLIERLHANPDTTLLLVDGTNYIVTESIDEVINSVVDFRARVLARTEELTADQLRPRSVVPLARPPKAR